MVCVGFLVQDLNSPWSTLLNSFPDMKYRGMCAFFDFPLRYAGNDSRCKMLTDRQTWEEDGNGLFVERHFISSRELLVEYLSECFKRQIRVRLLRLESDDYDRERYDLPCKEGTFLGYEVCPLPLDDQILSDLRFNPLCSGAVSRMSRMGLFDSLDDAREFKEKYLSLLDTGAAGDGEADIFVFGVYEMTDSFREDEVNLETVTALTDTDRISKDPDAKGHSDPGELFRGLKA